jgi:hypothetical protein
MHADQLVGRTRRYGASPGANSCLQCDYGYVLSVVNSDCTGVCVPALSIGQTASNASAAAAACTPRAGAECAKKVCMYMSLCVIQRLCIWQESRRAVSCPSLRMKPAASASAHSTRPLAEAN